MRHAPIDPIAVVSHPDPYLYDVALRAASGVHQQLAALARDVTWRASVNARIPTFA